ncbi:MAG: NUDIX hydrolase [Proteobacteria bacterium]|nr:MAG: NUDIX hydrolase [Pseudomonadota bacterium]
MSAADKTPCSFSIQVPEGDNRKRSVCDICGFIDYMNPKIVVGLVCSWREDELLLCRRAIEPQVGFWTLPAGYLECGEAPDVGACREAEEEAGAQVEIDQLLAVYTVHRISQVQMFYRARLRTSKLVCGPESQEVGLFRYEQVPWGELAFPTVHWALRHHREVRKKAVFAPFSNPAGGTGAYSELEQLAAAGGAAR